MASPQPPYPAYSSNSPQQPQHPMTTSSQYAQQGLQNQQIPFLQQPPPQAQTSLSPQPPLHRGHSPRPSADLSQGAVPQQLGPPSQEEIERSNRRRQELDQEVKNFIAHFENFDVNSESHDKRLPRQFTPQALAQYIDHTLLRPDAMNTDIEVLWQETVQWGFKSVCINSGWVGLCAFRADQLPGPQKPLICSVVGFPLGAMATDAKVAETLCAIEEGANEIDMVINIGHLRSGFYGWVLEDIKAVRRVCKTQSGESIVLKVILETGALTKDEIIAGCYLATKAGAGFVKTCTGFGPGFATVEDVRLIRACVKEDMGVKASGQVRNYESAIKLIKAGATRIGASSSVNIIQQGLSLMGGSGSLGQPTPAQNQGMPGGY